jgi:NAD(P)-dependent dehydrogenase (short-subunit alcohol dehydrogenase family)
MRLLLAALAAWLTFGLRALAADPGAAERVQHPPVALVTGSDRGLGLALTEELAMRGWRVVATCRDPAHASALQAFAAAHTDVTLEPLDVSDDAAIDRLATKYHDQPIDALINNAGITGDLARQHVGAIEDKGFEQVMRVNAYAPLRMAQAFLESVAASVVGIVSPGRVDTDMQRAYQAARAAAGSPLTTPVAAPADSARALVTYIETLSPDKGGRFYSYSGGEVPW